MSAFDPILIATETAAYVAVSDSLRDARDRRDRDERRIACSKIRVESPFRWGSVVTRSFGKTLSALVIRPRRKPFLSIL